MNVAAFTHAFSRAFAGAFAGAFTVSLSLLASGVAGAAPTFDNPLVRQRADPHVTLHADGYYYYTATVPEYDRIELRRTRDLNDLGKAETRVAWRKHASGPMSFHIWAPELHHIDGRWFLYFTAGRADAPLDIRLYVLENAAANPLEGSWIERGQLKTGWESFSLDATTFALEGQRYLLWTQRPASATGHITGVYIAKMNSPLSIDGPATLLTLPEYPWEKVKFDVNEAPAVLVKNGRVFMTYSAAATDASYALGMLTARAGANLLDPKAWTKSAQPVFKSSQATGQFGPGHNSFTTTPDGKTDILVYHARSFEQIPGDSLQDPNRHTRAQALRWKADGTPEFGEPVAD
jgi:GH43 family beta-xylosidase